MFLLDTNVVSELRRPSRADPRVSAWARSASMERLFLSVVTILELQQGILLSARRDAQQGAVLQDWLDGMVLPSFRGRVLAFDQAIALRCAGLHVPDPRPDRDSMIAATALEHGLTVVTRNVRDFEACGVAVFNPWLAAAPLD